MEEMIPTQAEGNCVVVRRGGEEAGGEPVARGIRIASEAGRSGRASTVWRSPWSSRGRKVNAAGVRGRLSFLSGEVCVGVLGCPSTVGVRRVARDGGGREVVARRAEVSRGRITGGVGVCREGPNAKPSVRTFVLVGVAVTAANPVRGLVGGV